MVHAGSGTSGARGLHAGDPALLATRCGPRARTYSGQREGRLLLADLRQTELASSSSTWNARARVLAWPAGLQGLAVRCFGGRTLSPCDPCKTAAASTHPLVSGPDDLPASLPLPLSRVSWVTACLRCACGVLWQSWRPARGRLERPMSRLSPLLASSTSAQL